MKIKRAIGGTIVLLCLWTTNAHADPYREPSESPMTPQDEKSLALQGQRFRVAVAFTKAYWFKAAIYAAVLEQARYDERQRQIVAEALEAIEESDSPEEAVEEINEESSEPSQPVNSDATSVGGRDYSSISQCESGGDWGINTGNGYYGGLQFSQSTWEGAGGLEFAPRADLASPEQQMTIADRIPRSSWPNC
jgi:Transglycosylase-like domain